MRKTSVFKKGMMLALFLFLSVSFVALSQEVKVTGTVTDPAGGPLPGVNIIVQGTTTGTITNVDGVYSIEVPADASLVFNFIGFQSEIIPVEGRQTIDVVLQEELMSLDEVVVVGYGTQRQEAVTGSVASMRGDELSEVPSSNVSEALQGRVAGVQMSRTSTKPGSEMQIRIRGTRSLNASNDPLVVLDGIPFAGSIGDINPNDIKSIDILKDASSTAIYGSRGANGVILITTEKGQKGQTATVNYHGYYGVKSLFAEYPMMDGPDFVALRQAAGQFTNTVDEFDDVNTNWQDLFYSSAMVTSHDLSVSGGADKASYNFGVGYYKDEAVIPGQNYERISFRGTLDQEIGDYVRVGFTSNNNYSVSNGNNMGLYGVLSMSPIADPFNEDGTTKRTVNMPLDEQWVYTEDVVNDLGDAWIDQDKAFGSYNTLFAEVGIPGIEGLKYRANLGLNFRTKNEGEYTGEGVFSSNPTTESTAMVANSLTTNWAIENLLTYDRTFNGKHNLNVVALYSAEETRYNRSHMSAKDIPSDKFQFYNLGHAQGEKTINPDNQDYSVSGLMSWMGRVMYSFQSKYMLMATFRSDASSRLAEGKKWHSYPAVSAGWNISEESFMDNVDFVNRLKLRVGYGQTSNQAVDPYKTLGRLNMRPYNFGSEYATGMYVSELPNDELGWEFSETWNYGIDFSLLRHRLSGSFEYYVQNTKDLLLSVNMPGTSGVGSYMANVGETRNKGFEVSLNGVIIDDRNGWTWEAGINLYSNNNELVALSSGREIDESNWWFVGHPINVIYDYERIGLWQEDDPYLDILEPGGNAGMIKVKYDGEYNEDGTPVRRIGSDDRQIIEVDPNFQGGFNTRVAYKNFDFTAIGAFQNGGTLISTLYSANGYLNMLSGRRGNVDVDYWTPQNTGARYPKPGGLTSGDNPKYGNTLGYFNASYLKVRAMTLGYNFDRDGWLDRTGLNNLRVYFTVQNPFVLFSPYYDESGMDPETNSYADENVAVTDQMQERLLTIGTNTPSTRNFLFGINLTF
ncbi:TonB-dependent receptor [Marinilabilia salmonicolor]|jgi:TonB-linked SusC/RagA family outer membrane protein|uniref:TonB-linked SusC/RagA family outer membrane protein n=1 Tax=Marinilabilia salmonicolor TaxID=989 RepID=A0A2T0XT49_9BACT|nr:TonB-dependent receptor [Marinilabilia salmonicolor]PRZ02125.1 TonB-linked SusC/RagA family outer membrane protein [Marinilabilia salmonicolor]RCW36080.1 TonB-linked SusC/RagA family outer membrane protein [Marinilabilia salmonicolor]